MVLCSSTGECLRLGSGHVEPRVSTTCNTQPLDDFISSARARNEKIVLLARGGKVASGVRPAKPPISGFPLETRATAGDIRSIVDGGLATRLSEHVAVIAQSAAGSEAKEVKKRIFSVPRMELDFGRVLSKVDLVIHHGTYLTHIRTSGRADAFLGGTGTTVSSLKSGKPQVIIPGFGDTSDQLHHGGRIEFMGCGRLVKPSARFNADVKPVFTSEVVDLVRDMLCQKDMFAEGCLKWQEKFDSLGDAEGVPVAIDTLRRIIAKIVLSKRSRESNGSGFEPASPFVSKC